jgi:hypothetical protein
LEGGGEVWWTGGGAGALGARAGELRLARSEGRSHLLLLQWSSSSCHSKQNSFAAQKMPITNNQEELQLVGLLQHQRSEVRYLAKNSPVLQEMLQHVSLLNREDAKRSPRSNAT